MNILLENIKKADKIAITGHVNPDGDCLGSCLGLYNYIKENYQDKKVKVYLEKSSKKFSYMKGYEDIDTTLFEKTDEELKELDYDFLICLDCSNKERLGYNQSLLDVSKKSLAIDHHISHIKYTDDLILEEKSSSNSEILCTLLEIDKFSKDVASCFYTGIIHDTGIFRYESTSNRTMEISGKLMQKGVEFSKIIDESFFARSFKKSKFLAEIIGLAKTYFNEKVIISYASKKKLEEYKLHKEDLDGVIDELRNVDTVEVAIFMYEFEEGKYKLSLRSKKYVDVSKVCASFGGGGHIRAAGCSLALPLKECIEKILERLKTEVL